MGWRRAAALTDHEAEAERLVRRFAHRPQPSGRHPTLVRRSEVTVDIGDEGRTVLDVTAPTVTLIDFAETQEGPRPESGAFLNRTGGGRSGGCGDRI